MPIQSSPLQPMEHDPDVGATPNLSLRVSVATLVRVVFKHPGSGERMLALERKATLHEAGLEVKSQPFGGAIRILDLGAVHDLIGDFHFDSARSRTVQDFRLYIRASAWPVLRELCIQHLSRVADPILETDSSRELAEEFGDTLGIALRPDQYASKAVATVVEDEAAPAANIHAEGIPTVRVFRVFEAHILDSSLADAMLRNSEALSDQDLRELAWVDRQNGGKGRANAMLVLPLKHLIDNYLGMPPEERDVTVVFEKHRLDETVPAILDGVAVPKYRLL